MQREVLSGLVTQPDPEGWFLTADKLRAQHPGIELFLAHPELGLEQMEDGEADWPARAELGTRWLGLARAEQQARLRDLLRALLQHAAAGRSASFLVLLDEGTTAAAHAWLARLHAAVPAARERPGADGGAVEGELTTAAIEPLAELPDGMSLLVKRDGRLWLEADGAWHGGRVGYEVWVDPWRAGELEQQLSAAWWNAAEQRQSAAEGRPLPAPRDGGRVSRQTRAEVLAAWNRGAKFVSIPLALLAYRLLPLPEALAALVSAVALFALLSTFDKLLEGWYERS